MGMGISTKPTINPMNTTTTMATIIPKRTSASVDSNFFLTIRSINTSPIACVFILSSRLGRTRPRLIFCGKALHGMYHTTKSGRIQ